MKKNNDYYADQMVWMGDVRKSSCQTFDIEVCVSEIIILSCRYIHILSSKVYLVNQWKILMLYHTEHHRLNLGRKHEDVSIDNSQIITPCHANGNTQLNTIRRQPASKPSTISFSALNFGSNYSANCNNIFVKMVCRFNLIRMSHAVIFGSSSSVVRRYGTLRCHNIFPSPVVRVETKVEVNKNLRRCVIYDKGVRDGSLKPCSTTYDDAAVPICVSACLSPDP